MLKLVPYNDNVAELYNKCVSCQLHNSLNGLIEIGLKFENAVSKEDC